MQSDNRILDDLARVATGALGTLQSARKDLRTLIRQQIERLLNDMDLVSRDEFETVKAMAAKARKENEALGESIAQLEAEFRRGKARRKTVQRKKSKSSDSAK